MDLSEALVDLLLVRLGREEEKQRVLELLVSELHMTREEARASVDKAPLVLLEAVPMGRARVIQNRLYPFVDLLPRMETVEDQQEEAPQEPPRVPEEEEDFGELDESASHTPPAPVKQEEKLSVTSASEEVLSIERCHVCGRTPTGGEKLAPCRSCAELTCRDCFDRIAHVCQKCAADGKVVDAPLARTASSRPQSRHGSDQTMQTAPASPGRGGSRNIAYVAAGVAVLGLLAAFYFLDPLRLFHAVPPDAEPADSTAVAPLDTVPADTLTLPPDSTAIQGPDDPGDEDILSSLSGLPLPPGVDSITDAPAVPLETQAPSGIDVMAEAGEMLEGDLARIAASIPVTVDRFAVFRMPDSTVVAAVTILHPVEDTYRYALLRALTAWLGEGPVDELVFYYSESEYYPVRTVSFVRASFSTVSACMGPVDFQNCAGTTNQEVWNILSGPLQDWMARY